MHIDVVHCKEIIDDMRVSEVNDPDIARSLADLYNVLASPLFSAIIGEKAGM